MAKIDLTSQEWCQLIFEGKNQAYGAFKMRANSTKRHNLAMLAVLVIALIGFTIPTLVKLATPKQKEVICANKGKVIFRIAQLIFHFNEL